METLRYVFALLVLLPLSSFVIAEPPPPPAPSPHHFRLSLTWPFGYCSFVTCAFTPLPTKFTIQGFWPVDINSTLIQFCPLHGPAWAELTAQYQDLRDCWPRLVAPDNPDLQKPFWVTEYVTHGTCDPQPPRDYFLTAINNYREHDVFQALISDDVNPGLAHARTEFEDALRERLGIEDFILKCLRDPSDNLNVLIAIQLCFGSSGTAYISCPSQDIAFEDNCGYANIKFVAQVVG